MDRPDSKSGSECNSVSFLHCPGHHVGDERHLVFECPALQHIPLQYTDIFSDAHSTMRLFMWHTDQKAMASCLLRLLSEYDSLLG